MYRCAAANEYPLITLLSTGPAELPLTGPALNALPTRELELTEEGVAVVVGRVCDEVDDLTGDPELTRLSRRTELWITGHHGYAVRVVGRRCGRCGRGRRDSGCHCRGSRNQNSCETHRQLRS